MIARRIVGPAAVRSVAVLILAYLMLPGTVGLTPAAANILPSSNSLYACGVITAYVPATATAQGAITLSQASSYVIVPGVTIAGVASVAPTALVCLSATVNALGQITSGSVVPVAISGSTSSACGVVTAYVPATALAPGLLTIGNQVYAIAPGVTLSAATGALLGMNVCLAGTINGLGQLIAGTLTFPTVGTPSACGVVTVYQPAGVLAAGVLVIGTQTFTLAPASSFVGPASLAVGANVCLTGVYNSIGQIVTGTVTIGTPTSTGPAATICGTVSAYLPATAAAAGVLQLAGITLPIAANVVLGGNVVAVGSPLCLNAAIGAAGVTSGTVSTNGNRVNGVVGSVTGYVPATATTAGTIQINGINFTIAAGTTLTIVSGVPLSATLVAAPRLSAGVARERAC